MASVSMMASFISGATIAQQSLKTRRSLLTTKATADKPETTMSFEGKEEKMKTDGRRAAMFAVAATAVSVLAGSTLADEDVPKRGTPEARKKYAPVCVTMPTARICHKVA